MLYNQLSSRYMTNLTRENKNLGPFKIKNHLVDGRLQRGLGDNPPFSQDFLHTFLYYNM